MISDLISTTIAKGITLSNVNGELRFRAAPGALDEELKQQLRDNKPALLAWLAEKQRMQNLAIEPTPLIQVAASPGQTRLWLLDSIQDGSSEYNMPGLFKVNGSLDVDMLRQSFACLIKRHDVFQYAIEPLAGKPYLTPQTVDFHVDYQDLSLFPSAEQVSLCSELTEKALQKPFDLSCPPLLEVLLIKLDQAYYHLVVNIHHIISDGWSMAILIKELCHAYESLLRHQPPSLTPLPLRYRDYTEWQNRRLSGAYEEYLSAYWLPKLADSPAVHSLPLDFRRSETKQPTSQHFTMPLGAEETQILRAFAKQHNCSTFTLMYCAFASLLVRWGHEPDVILGTPVSGRTKQELNNLVGFFVNTLVLRLTVDLERSFSDMLTIAKKEVLNSFEFQDMQLDSLIEKLKPPRIAGSAPLFQIMFAYQDYEQPSLQLAGARLTQQEITHLNAKFDLQLEVNAQADTMSLSWEFNAAIFAAETITSLSCALQMLLQSVVAQPAMPLKALRMTPPTVATGQPTAPPATGSIAERFSRTVARCPEKIAVNDGRRPLSYLALDQQANQLANHLCAQGVSRGDRVGILLQRGNDAIIAILAVCKLGACYVPIDPAYPTERITQIVAIASLKCLIHIEETPLESELIHTIDLSRDHWQQQPATPSATPQIQAVDPAYVLFTSGSTGKPKGVCVTQSNVISLVDHQRYVEFNEQRVFAHISNIAFDAATFEIWGALLNGGRLEILTTDTVVNANLFGAAIRSRGIDSMFVTSALFNRLVEQDPSLFAPANYVLVGGDVVSPHSARKVLQSNPPKHLINGYGPTESTTFAICWEIDLASTLKLSSLPIGFPLEGRGALILDAARQPVPQGAVGELYLTGSGVAQGYLENPELNAEKFIEQTIDGSRQRWYRTGDLARQRFDNAIEFIGRTDDLVKIRGYRIELSEIEQAVLTTPWCQQCHADIHTEASGDKSIVCYITGSTAASSEESAAQIEQLKSSLGTQLPDFMLPQYFELLPEFPLNHNGKLDKRALPPPKKKLSGRSIVAAVTDMERYLVNLWRELLALEEVSCTDNFFHLGGHSLLASQMASRIYADINVHLRLSDVFNNHSLADLAAMLEKQNTVFSHLEATDLLQQISHMSETEVAALMQQFEKEH